MCASTVLECSCCRIHRYVAAPYLRISLSLFLSFQALPAWMYHYPWLTFHVLYVLYSGRGLDYLWGMTPHGSSSQYLHTVQHTTHTFIHRYTTGTHGSHDILYIPSQDPATLAAVLITFSRPVYVHKLLLQNSHWQSLHFSAYCFS
jgi:hypothetical protein